jgi:Uri superfamily endonuclease
MNSGCYQIRIKVSKNISLNIGALGLCSFHKGYYIYTGSALKNLYQRVDRHKRINKKMHWHIDYLLAHPSVQLIDVITHPSEIREECFYNQQLINQGAEVPVKGFGSSDCKVCLSHLLKVEKFISP